MEKMKKIAILGSTGSIGTQTLEVARENGDLEVVGLAAGNNVELLEAQIREFHPRKVAVWTEEKAAELRLMVSDLNVEIVTGMEGLIEIAEMEEAEILVTAIVGMIGIRPTIAAIKTGKDIALANKETLVTAGHIIMPLAKEYNVKILPVDSEHSAIFQCLNGENHRQLSKILLTASGGPFRGRKRAHPHLRGLWPPLSGRLPSRTDAKDRGSCLSSDPLRLSASGRSRDCTPAAMRGFRVLSFRFRSPLRF